jgi:starch-binding outer membrane protein, SusD/RagB family
MINMKIMKNIYYRAVLLNAFMASICVACTKEFLDQKPTSSITEVSYFKNVDELETGLVACYAALNYQYWNSFEMNHWTIGDIGSDDADCGSLYTDQPDGYNLSYSRQNASNYWILGPWYTNYAIISRCNYVIDKSSEVQGDTIQIRKIVNQAKFLRAMVYYHLVTDYGDIPLFTKFLNPDELNLKRAPSDSVWKQIELDLKAATNLPTKHEWNESGRVTSGAAWSLLGKVYITERKYEQANQAFSQVVNSGQYSLVDDFGFIFRHDGENCDESIFEIQHMTNIASGGNMGTASAPFRLPRDASAGGWGFDCPTKDLLSEFEAGDPRIIYTFMFPGDVFPVDETTTYTVVDTLSPTGYNSRKAWIPWSERAGLNWSDWDINYRYMRYAEILLLYAESLNEVGKPTEALNLLNQVRFRARNTTTTDPQRISCAYDLSHSDPLLPDVTTTDQSQLRQAIWHEQRVELAIEGHRRNTLLRTNRFADQMEKAKAYAGVTVEPYEWLLPIPQQEIELSNHVLTQNPGY